MFSITMVNLAERDDKTRSSYGVQVIIRYFTI
jgi:hypothetical protein